MARGRADEIAAWGRRADDWVPPSSLGQIPADLRERAARLLSDPALGLWDLERNEPADPEAGPVVAALARAGDPDLADEMRKHGAELLAERYSWQAIAGATAAVYAGHPSVS